MDALDLLEQQHHDLGELFAHASEASAPGRRTAYVARLVRAVEAHSRVEESVFYAAISAQIGGAEARLYEAFEDHALLRFAAVNLLRTRATDLRFPARLKLVHTLFRRHVAVEEDWLFPKAKRALSDEALERIGQEIERAHATRLAVAPLGATHPAPRRWPAHPGSCRVRASATV
jgi:hemerythrin superfamily protein